jgi:hypothetical protein
MSRIFKRLHSHIKPNWGIVLSGVLPFFTRTDMPKQATELEKALAHYLKNGHVDDNEVLMDDHGEERDTEVEIAILPGYHASNLDDMYIQIGSNNRVGNDMIADVNLKRFFELVNVHPRDVLTEEDLSMKPAEIQPYYSNAYRDHLNHCNAAHLKGYLELLTDFEIDTSRPAMCSAETARALMINASYGGVPIIAGRAWVSDIMKLDFDKPIRIAGKYQVGIYQNCNGAGHMEANECEAFEMKLHRGDLFVCATKGWTPDQTFGFVGSYYKLELSTAMELTPA